MFFESAQEDYNVLYSFEDSYKNDLVAKILECSDKTSNYKFLDLGGGNGEFANSLRKNTNWDVAVADYSKKLLKSAEKKNLRTIHMDLNNLDSSEKYDIILIKFCIHFVNNYPYFYQSICELLNDNGKIFIISRPQRTEYPFTDKLHQQWKDCVFTNYQAGV